MNLYDYIPKCQAMQILAFLRDMNLDVVVMFKFYLEQF